MQSFGSVNSISATGTLLAPTNDCSLAGLFDETQKRQVSGRRLLRHIGERTVSLLFFGVPRISL